MLFNKTYGWHCAKTQRIKTVRRIIELRLIISKMTKNFNNPQKNKI